MDTIYRTSISQTCEDKPKKNDGFKQVTWESSVSKSKDLISAK